MILRRIAPYFRRLNGIDINVETKSERTHLRSTLTVRYLVVGAFPGAVFGTCDRVKLDRSHREGNSIGTDDISDAVT